MNNNRRKMSYVVIEPFGIKCRRLFEKITNTKDPKVTEFDNITHKKMFETSHGIVQTKPETDSEELPPIIR